MFFKEDHHLSCSRNAVFQKHVIPSRGDWGPGTKPVSGQGQREFFTPENTGYWVSPQALLKATTPRRVACYLYSSTALTWLPCSKIKGLVLCVTASSGQKQDQPALLLASPSVKDKGRHKPSSKSRSVHCSVSESSSLPAPTLQDHCWPVSQNEWDRAAAHMSLQEGLCPCACWHLPASTPLASWMERGQEWREGMKEDGKLLCWGKVGRRSKGDLGFYFVFSSCPEFSLTGRFCSGKAPGTGVCYSFICLHCAVPLLPASCISHEPGLCPSR